MSASSATASASRSRDANDQISEQRRQMALRHVRQYPDPVLKADTRPIDQFDSELEALASRMFGIMRDAMGVGLAAPQLGLRLRMFTFQDADEEQPQAVVNPRITVRSDETDVEEEGCLSLGDVRVPVERHVSITVEAQDLQGETVTWELEGFRARVFQHEMDHLDGVLIIDRAADAEARAQAMSELRPRP